ncbi:MAG TPA: EcsC family protein [Actinomycetales bacterium]|nr:EcsC family protein [Actinomycetales bacterium]
MFWGRKGKPGSREPSGLEQAASTLVSKLVDAGIDGVGPLDPAADVAEKARARNKDLQAAIDEIITSHKKLAAANGFVTGLGGFVTLPVALPANILGFYAVATRMVGAIAHLRGYSLHRPEVRSAVMLTLIGADATSVLSKAGLNPVGRVAGLAMRQLPAPALMVLNKGIGFQILSQTAKRNLTRLGRGVPLAGGVIGAGLDWWLLDRIGDDAKDEFVHRELVA